MAKIGDIKEMIQALGAWDTFKKNHPKFPEFPDHQYFPELPVFPGHTELP